MYHLIDAQGVLVSSHADRRDAVDAQSARPDLKLDYQPCYAGALTGKHNGAYCAPHKCTCIKCRPLNESDPALHTLKRLSPAQVQIFSRCPAATVTPRTWVTFTDADALISELDALTGVDQRTQMRCTRRVLQEVGRGDEITVKPRQPAPRALPCHITLQTTTAGAGVLTFINDQLVSGLIASTTHDRVLINRDKADELLTLLRYMHSSHVSTRTTGALITALEAEPHAPFSDTFSTAPLHTPAPAAPLIKPAPVSTPAPAAVIALDDDDEHWVEDDAFTAQYERTSARVHDPLYNVRPAPDEHVTLPLTPAYWGAVFSRVQHILTDYGYEPVDGAVSVRRAHVAGLRKQLEVISVHGHGGRFIDYQYEAALDDELEQWAAQAG
jgi:hypothetical protein